MSRKSNRRRHRRRQEHQRQTAPATRLPEIGSASAAEPCPCALCWLESQSRADLLAVAPRLDTASHIVAFASVLAEVNDHLRVLFVLDEDGRIIDLARCPDDSSPIDIGDIAWSCFGLLPQESMLVVVSVEWERATADLGSTSDALVQEFSGLFDQAMVLDTNGAQAHITSVTARDDPWDVVGMSAEAAFDGFAGLLGDELS